MNTANISVQYRKHHDVTYSVFRKKVFFHNLSKYVVLEENKITLLQRKQNAYLHVFKVTKLQHFKSLRVKTAETYHRKMTVLEQHRVRFSKWTGLF